MISSTTALHATATAALSNTSTFLVRIVFLRLLAIVYMAAFACALFQNKALIGDDGITPARLVLDQAQERGRQNRERRLQWRQYQAKAVQLPWRLRARRAICAALDRNPTWVKVREALWDRKDRADRPLQPTLLWLARDRSNLDPVLDSIAQTGLALSFYVLAKGAANVPLVLGLWLCHRSLMAVGGPWYGYGWEPQLSEIGYLAAMLVPLWSVNPLHPMAMSPVIIWCARWHLFRIMLGAGLIKLRSGDRKWKDLTTMDYFYETQPVPNPLTRYFHWMPRPWHKFEVLTNHFVELVAPWLLLVPQSVSSSSWLPLLVNLRRAAGMIQLAFQVVLISSGNLSFLNWLTMVPAVLCLDDALLGRFFSPLQQSAAMAADQASWMYFSRTRQLVNFVFLALILKLSVPVVKNLASKKQVMNQSYDPLRLVNTYGVFGTVSEVREEFIISSATAGDGEWREYEFKVKPGNVRKAPRFLSPYHYRLDWQMWLAATCRTLDRSATWLYPFLIKLLQQDKAVLNDLMMGDPWEEDRNSNAPGQTRQRPKYIRVERYRYTFHRPEKGETKPRYWNRELIDQVYPRQGLATVESLQKEIPRGWR